MRKLAKGTVVKFYIEQYTTIAIRNKIDNLLSDKIDLDIAVKKLYNSHKITGPELLILEIMSEGRTPALGAEEAKMSKWRFIKIYNSVAKKISDILGWEYSEERLENSIKMRGKK